LKFGIFFLCLGIYVGTSLLMPHFYIKTDAQPDGYINDEAYLKQIDENGAFAGIFGSIINIVRPFALLGIIGSLFSLIFGIGDEFKDEKKKDKEKKPDKKEKDIKKVQQLTKRALSELKELNTEFAEKKDKLLDVRSHLGDLRQKKETGGEL